MWRIVNFSGRIFLLLEKFIERDDFFKKSRSFGVKTMNSYSEKCKIDWNRGLWPCYVDLVSASLSSAFLFSF